ncbi:MAG: hypothetical protein ACKVQS_05810 [Fimbriimonadaceae bacterium]
MKHLTFVVLCIIALTVAGCSEEQAAQKAYDRQADIEAGNKAIGAEEELR